MSTETVSALDNPELAAQLAQAAIAMSNSVEEEETQASPVDGPVEITPPPSGDVKLLAGIYNSFTGELVDTAEIRELTGVDEEAIAKISDYGRSLMAILDRATVKIGEEKATPAVLDRLLAGDREYLIIQIRIATFGNEIALKAKCADCNEIYDFTIDLNTDLTINRFDDPISDRSITVDCKVGEVLVEFPNGAVQRKLINIQDRTAAEMDTVLLKECVIEINGQPVVNVDQVKNLGMQDRRKILAELSEKNPGPDLSKLAKDCPSCGLEVPLPLTLADLFLL